MAIDRKIAGYSRVQIALHWIVVFLVAFQYLTHKGIELSWTALERGNAFPSDQMVLTYMHIGAGTLVTMAAVARLYLRSTRGAPPPPEDEPHILQLVSELVHGIIYALLLMLPVTGAIAWFSGISEVGFVHALLTNVLLAAIVLHIAGALFQHLVRRSQVMVRMFRSERR